MADAKPLAVRNPLSFLMPSRSPAAAIGRLETARFAVADVPGRPHLKRSHPRHGASTRRSVAGRSVAVLAACLAAAAPSLVLAAPPVVPHAVPAVPTQSGTPPPAPEGDATSRSVAARSRMLECGHQWSAMKKAGTATGTWKDFSRGCLAQR